MPLSPEDRGKLVAAKAKLSLDFLVVPVPAFARETGRWRRMTDERVLALREVPPGLADYALVKDVDNEVSIQAALQWVLGNHQDSRAVTIDKTLAGFGYREMSIDELKYENISHNMKLNDGAKVPIFREEGAE